VSFMASKASWRFFKHLGFFAMNARDKAVPGQICPSALTPAKVLLISTGRLFCVL
jgi:hypothetical protein